MHIEHIILNQVGPFNNVILSIPKGSDDHRADVCLLTGPNGSGKSTVLYAIASILCAMNPNLGQDHLGRRLKSVQSFAAFNADGHQRAVAWFKVGDRDRNAIPNPFGGGNLTAQRQNGMIGQYVSSMQDALGLYPEKAGNFRVDHPKDARPRFAWAAFAYAGMRTISDGLVTAIQEPTDSPFQNSLSFVHTADTNRLAQWIANQQFKKLKAKEAGRHERAAQIERSTKDIEQVVSSIIEEPFAFVTNEDDNNVRVKRGGQVIDLGLLPDGLKSIVSWIADLLMRLDRIPWIDDTPVLQRPFLLLLDEVDIHLHPSWQRKVLPIVQQMFPKAQIIASTHSPFVVASVTDAHVVSFAVTNGVSTVESILPSSQVGVSYSSVLRSIFGIKTDFNMEVEGLFKRFHDAKQRVLAGQAEAKGDVDAIAASLAEQGEEVSELIGLELRQLERQLRQRATS